MIWFFDRASAAAAQYPFTNPGLRVEVRDD